MATYENTSGIGVAQYYGPAEQDMDVEGRAFISQGDGSYEAIVMVDSTNYAVQTTRVLPKGAIIRKVVAHITEVVAFTGGTSPTIVVGTDTSEATNKGMTIPDAQAADTIIDGTLAGTWASPLTADTTVGVALTGSPTSLDTGKAKVVIYFDLV